LLETVALKLERPAQHATSFALDCTLIITVNIMAYDLEEQEQLEQFKAVWAKWGTLIMGLVALIAVSFAAYQGYHYYQRTQADKAAPLFEQLEKAATEINKDLAEDLAKAAKNPTAKVDESVKLDSKNVQLVVDLAKKLTQEHANTAYAQLGALQAATIQANLGKTTEANALLQWTVDSAKDPEYSYVARVRLASALIDAKKPEQALALLAGEAPKGFEMLYADRRGDAFSASNKLTEAKAEYQKAWDLTDKKSVLREVIDQKMQLLGLDLVKPAETDKDKLDTAATEKTPA
jgi:predicted negative regulator of RcsB-dependent stress response